MQTQERVSRWRTLRCGDAQVGKGNVPEASARPLVADWCARYSFVELGK